MEFEQSGTQQFGAEILCQVMARLSDPQADFTLHVSDGFSERVSYFAAGGVRMLSVGERHNAGPTRYLVARGVVDVEKVQSLLKEAKASGRPLRDLLISSGLLSEEDYQDIIRKLLRDDLQDLVFWDDAYYNSYDGSPPEEVYEEGRRALAARLDCRQLSEEVCEWAKKWSHLKTVLHSDRANVVLTEAGVVAAEKLSDRNTRGCLNACRSGPSLRELWQFVGQDLPVLCDSLVEHVKSGWVKIKAPPTRDSVENLQRAIARLEENLPKVIDKGLLREKLAALYTRTGAVERAVRELKLLAEAAFAKGRWQLGVAKLKTILDLQPENIDALRETLNAQCDHELEKEAMEFGVAHAKRLLERHLPAEARLVATELKLVRGGRQHALRIEADALAASGQMHTAVPKYLALVREFEEKEEFDTAVEILRRVLSFQPDDESIQARLRELEAKPVFRPRAPRTPGAEKGAAKDSAAPASGARPFPIDLSRRALIVHGALQLALVVVVFTVLGLLGVVSFGFSGAEAERGVDRGREPVVRAIGGEGELSFAGGVTDASACPHDAAHRFLRWPLDADRVVSFADSCSLRVLDAASGKVLQSFNGRSGARWAVGYRGERICLWEPGERLVLYGADLEPAEPPAWVLPAETSAIAIGRKEVALRRGNYTVIQSYDGHLLKGSELPVWNDGVFVDDLLIVVRRPTAAGKPAQFWAIRRRDMKVAWTGSVVDGLPSFR